jgi:hypothetical protein
VEVGHRAECYVEIDDPAERIRRRQAVERPAVDGDEPDEPPPAQPVTAHVDQDPVEPRPPVARIAE